MARHEFGIMERFEENRWYTAYEPEVYDCVGVEMDTMDRVFDAGREALLRMNTYACVSTQPIRGLIEYAVTLIPPDALGAFLDAVAKANKTCPSPELDLLAEKIREAMGENKYMIHFGI